MADLYNPYELELETPSQYEHRLRQKASEQFYMHPVKKVLQEIAEPGSVRRMQQEFEDAQMARMSELHKLERERESERARVAQRGQTLMQLGQEQRNMDLYRQGAQMMEAGLKAKPGSISSAYDEKEVKAKDWAKKRMETGLVRETGRETRRTTGGAARPAEAFDEEIVKYQRLPWTTPEEEKAEKLRAVFDMPEYRNAYYEKWGAGNEDLADLNMTLQMYGVPLELGDVVDKRSRARWAMTKDADEWGRRHFGDMWETERDYFIETGKQQTPGLWKTEPYEQRIAIYQQMMKDPRNNPKTLQQRIDEEVAEFLGVTKDDKYAHAMRFDTDGKLYRYNAKGERKEVELAAVKNAQEAINAIPPASVENDFLEKVNVKRLQNAMNALNILRSARGNPSELQKAYDFHWNHLQQQIKGLYIDNYSSAVHGGKSDYKAGSKYSIPGRKYFDPFVTNLYNGMTAMNPVLQNIWDYIGSSMEAREAELGGEFHAQADETASLMVMVQTVLNYAPRGRFDEAQRAIMDEIVGIKGHQGYFARKGNEGKTASNLMDYFRTYIVPKLEKDGLLRGITQADRDRLAQVAKEQKMRVARLQKGSEGVREGKAKTTKSASAAKPAPRKEKQEAVQVAPRMAGREDVNRQTARMQRVQESKKPAGTPSKAEPSGSVFETKEGKPIGTAAVDAGVEAVKKGTEDISKGRPYKEIEQLAENAKMAYKAGNTKRMDVLVKQARAIYDRLKKRYGPALPPFESFLEGIPVK